MDEVETGGFEIFATFKKDVTSEKVLVFSKLKGDGDLNTLTVMYICNKIEKEA